MLTAGCACNQPRRKKKKAKLHIFFVWINICSDVFPRICEWETKLCKLNKSIEKKYTCEQAQLIVGKKKKRILWNIQMYNASGVKTKYLYSIVEMVWKLHNMLYWNRIV